MKGKIYLIYDSRRATNGSAGVVFEVCETLEEARKNVKNYGNGNVIVEAFTEGKMIVKESILEIH